MKKIIFVLSLVLFAIGSFAYPNPEKEMQKPVLEQVRAVMLDKGYSFFEKGDLNLNIIAIRVDDVFDNQFSDFLVLPHKSNGIWTMPVLPFTTLAGTLGFGGEKAPLTAAQTGTGLDGVAIIKENQYPGGLTYIKNGWRYPFVEYLKQSTEFEYYRDNDKNGIVTRSSPQQKGDFSTHLHAMSGVDRFGRYTKSSYVNYTSSAWSQGCMGNDAYTFFTSFMPIVRQAVKLWGARFTLTLLHGKDFA